jgi:transposase
LYRRQWSESTIGRGAATKRYGTIICDLEKRKTIALLPDREPATAQTWLSDQPQITVVARDRGGGFAIAAAKALPKATQVADRWHVMENASRASSTPCANRCGKMLQCHSVLAPRLDAVRPPLPRAAAAVQVVEQLVDRHFADGERRVERADHGGGHVDLPQWQRACV